MKRSSSSSSSISLSSPPSPQPQQQKSLPHLAEQAREVAASSTSSSNSSITDEPPRSTYSKLVDAANVPALPNSITLKSAASAARVVALEDELAAVAAVRKVAEEERKKARQLGEAHLRRQAEADSERQRRLRLLESTRLEQEAAERSRREAEDRELSLKEKKRQDFIRKITEQETARAKQAAKVREEKEKKRLAAERLLQKERDSEKREMELMFVEDGLSYAMDLGRLLRDRARLVKKQEFIKRKKEEASNTAEIQVERKPRVPRLSKDPHSSAKVRNKLMLEVATRNKFEQLDTDGSGFLEKKEIDAFMGEVFEVYGALDKTYEEKVAFRQDLMNRVDLNGDGKLDFFEFSRLWKDMREHASKRRVQEREVARAAEALEEEKRRLAAEAAAPTEAQLKEIENRERQAAQQRALRRLAERIAREKANKAGMLVAENERKLKLDKVVEEAKKLVVAAPTRMDIRKQQIKRLLHRQRKTRESLEAAQESKRDSLIAPDSEKAALLLRNFAALQIPPPKAPPPPEPSTPVVVADIKVTSYLETPNTGAALASSTTAGVDGCINKVEVAKVVVSKHPKTKFVSQKQKKIPNANVKQKRKKYVNIIPETRTTYLDIEYNTIYEILF